MPRRKKLPPLPANPDYAGLGSTNKDPQKWLVQKSNPLRSLSETSLTLPEFKILDAYLSRIDSHNPEARYVRFERGELEKLLGVVKIPKQELEKRLKNLFQVLTIRDERKPKGFKLIALFAKAECEQDEDGLWQVNLACSVEAMEYVFNIENIGYLRYRLQNIINLTSRYSYVLYLYLEDNRRFKTWEIKLQELKNLLNCTADTYSEYKRFNDLVLKKCHKELNEKTSLNFSYEPVKKGRKVVAVRFSLETLADILPKQSEAEQLSLLDEQEKEIDYGSDLADLLGSAACNDEFDPKQIRVIQDLVLKAAHTRDHMELCDFLIHRMHLMEYRNSQQPIHDRFSYLCSMLSNEINEQ